MLGGIKSSFWYIKPEDKQIREWEEDMYSCFTSREKLNKVHAKSPHNEETRHNEMNNSFRVKKICENRFNQYRKLFVQTDAGS